MLAIYVAGGSFADLPLRRPGQRSVEDSDGAVAGDNVAVNAVAVDAVAVDAVAVDAVAVDADAGDAMADDAIAGDAIAGDLLQGGKMPKRASEGVRTACLLLEYACRQSGLPPLLHWSKRDLEKTGIIVGANTTNLSAICGMEQDASLYGVNQTNPALFPDTVLNSIAGSIAIHFQITGINITISDGERTALHALRCAADMLEDGWIERLAVFSFNLTPPEPFAAVMKRESFHADSISCLLLERRSRPNITIGVARSLEHAVAPALHSVSDIVRTLAEAVSLKHSGLWAFQHPDDGVIHARVAARPPGGSHAG